MGFRKTYAQYVSDPLGVPCWHCGKRTTMISTGDSLAVFCSALCVELWSEENERVRRSHAFADYHLECEDFDNHALSVRDLPDHFIARLCSNRDPRWWIRSAVTTRLELPQLLDVWARVLVTAKEAA